MSHLKTLARTFGHHLGLTAELREETVEEPVEARVIKIIEHEGSRNPLYKVTFVTGEREYVVRSKDEYNRFRQGEKVAIILSTKYELTYDYVDGDYSIKRVAHKREIIPSRFSQAVRYPSIDNLFDEAA